MSSPYDSSSFVFDNATVIHQAIHTAAQDDHLQSPLSRPSSCTVQNLPVETLGEIFMHCVDEVIALDAAPLLLLQICHSWREVAIGTPRLWTDLDFDGWSDESNPCPMIRMWLENSRSLCIDLNLGSGYDAPKTYQQEKMSIIVPNIHRFRRLECPISKHFLKELRDQVLPILAPSLEELDLTPIGFSTPPTIMGLMECIRAPHLASISLIPQSQMMDLFTGTSTLRTVNFNIENDCPRGIRLLEQSCNQLQTLRLSLLAGEFAFNPTVCFPSLRKLYIESSFGLPTTSLISSFTAPNLEDLCINMGLIIDSMEREPIGPFWEAIDAFLAGNHPILKLSILNVPIESGRFLAMLSRISHLRSLEITSVAVEGPVFQELMLQDSNTGRSTICPHLSDLQFRYAHLNGALLVQLVSARTFPHWNAAAGIAEDFSCLTDLTLESCDGMESSHLYELFEIEDKCDGLFEINFDGN